MTAELERVEYGLISLQSPTEINIWVNRLSQGLRMLRFQQR